MDGFGFFSCIQFFIMLGVCFAIIYRERLIALEDRIRERRSRRRFDRSAKRLESVGMSVVPAPAMTAKEVVRLMEEY